jgi:hypothetical protein
MPTVLRIGPYRFYFFSNEGSEPPHVHVDRDAYSAKFWLLDVSLARNHGFRPHELANLLALVQEHRATILEAWHGHFGA